ncbi:MAG: hypothetical protein ABIC95_01115 [archaeon]
MKFAEKDISYYWPIIKLPFWALLIWNVAAMVVAWVSFDLFQSIFSQWASLLIGVAAFGFAGYTAVKDHKGGIRHAAWSGALLGVAIGLVGAVIYIVMLAFVPQIIDLAMAQVPPEAGMGRDQLATMMQMMSYIQLITGPLFNALIGALLGAVSGFVAKKV